MKRQLFLIVTGTVCFSVFYVQLLTAQNVAPYWSINGNTNALTTSKFGTVNSIPLRIMTKNKEWIRVDTVGRVGIGTITPSQKLHVLGNALITGNLGVGVTPTQKLHVAGNGLITGSVGIGAIASGAKLNVVGSITAGNGINVSGYSNGLSANATYAYGTGVSATSDQGYAVYGTSNYLGVYGYAPNGSYGTYGYSKYIGVYGAGTTYGVYGYSSTTAGVYAVSSSGYGLQGVSTDNYGGYFTSTNNYALVASTTNAYYAGVFYGHVYSSLGFVTSDKNLKKDVQDFSDAMSIINKLKPENYLFKDDAKYASLHLPKGRHYGLLAQDLEQFLPNLVSEAPHVLTIASKPSIVVKPGADGTPQPVVAEAKETKETINIKAVNYVELIPIMVKAMQEQDVRMKAQDEEIANLKSEITQLKTLILKNANSSTGINLPGYLEQNNPNPLNGYTAIKYFAPSDAQSVQILVTDIKGSLVKTYKVPTGQGQVIIKKDELANGSYNYTLYVDNKQIDTKRMIVIR